jgi:hypothetical protein
MSDAVKAEEEQKQGERQTIADEAAKKKREELLKL